MTAPMVPPEASFATMLAGRGVQQGAAVTTANGVSAGDSWKTLMAAYYEPAPKLPGTDIFGPCSTLVGYYDHPNLRG